MTQYPGWDKVTEADLRRLRPHLHDIGRTKTCYCGAKPGEPHLIAGRETPAKRQKYSAQPHIVLPDLRVLPEGECGGMTGGIRFASKREALRFVDLRLELEAGRILDLLLQEQFALHVVNPQGVKIQIGTCRMDFTYTKDGKRIREDSKGFSKNEAYRQRKKHVETEYGISISET